MTRRSRLTATVAFVAILSASGCSLPTNAPEPSVTQSRDPAAAAYLAASNRGSGPDVEEMSIREGRRLAAEWCVDLEVDNLGWAVRSVNEQASQMDAIKIGLFALDEVCPELEPKARVSTQSGPNKPQ